MADGSITRTLRVLTAVCEEGPQTLKTLSEKTGLSSPTLLRTLRLMADEGFVTQQPDRTWRATMLVWRLGHAVNSTIGVASVARGYTERITHEVDESSVFAVYENDQVTYSARSEAGETRPGAYPPGPQLQATDHRHRPGGARFPPSGSGRRRDRRLPRF